MKKMPFLCFAAIFVLIFCGCGGEYKISPVTQNFSCDFKATADGKDIYKGTADFSDGGNVCFEFAFPQSVEGLLMKSQKNGFSFSYGGIDSAEGEGTINASCFGAVKDILLDVSQNNAPISGEEMSVSGSCSEGKYKLQFRADGFPQKFSFKDKNIAVEFSDFQYNF